MAIKEKRADYYLEDKIEDAFVMPICNTCKHKELKAIKCKAYPDRIPNSILTNKIDNRKPYMNDNGIQYEPNEKNKC